MTTDNQIFKCYFTDVSLFDRLSVWGYSVVMIIVLALIHKKGHIATVLFLGLLFTLIPLWFEFMSHMIRTRSYIKLTDRIVFKIWMNRSCSFPIDKIESIRVVDFDKDNVDRLTQQYRLPISMGYVNLYPQKGVIVFFDRKWIKSVQPIFFNASNPEQFAMALAKESGKPLTPA